MQGTLDFPQVKARDTFSSVRFAPSGRPALAPSPILHQDEALHHQQQRSLTQKSISSERSMGSRSVERTVKTIRGTKNSRQPRDGGTVRERSALKAARPRGRLASPTPEGPEKGEQLVPKRQTAVLFFY